VVFVAAGMVQNFSAGSDITTLAGATQHITGGPVASQEIIKELGTNGGGFYNVNSAHPFENPTSWTNWLEIFLLLVISFSLPRTFGRMVGSTRQGYAIVTAMAIMAVGSIALINVLQGMHSGSVPQAVGAATEGTETRFGVLQSATFASATTLTSTGAVDSFHDSYTSLGGGVAMFNMMLGEVAPGGTGSGLYGLLVLAVLTVFIAGLMVGRTPEYLGKKVQAKEVKLAMLAVLILPLCILGGTSICLVLENGMSSLSNAGPHGLSEMLYAFTSATGNNGSAFAGITADTPLLDYGLGVAMLLGRFAFMIPVLAIAGSLAAKPKLPPSAGTFPTHGPLFIGLLIGVILILGGLQFLPAQSLGPLAEHYSMLAGKTF